MSTAIEDRAHANGHVPSLAVYFAIFFALLALTGITVGVAFVDLGALNTIVALGVAGIKATLVAIYFMHLRHARRLTWVVATGGFLWLAILITFTLSDVLTRGWLGRS